MAYPAPRRTPLSRVRGRDCESGLERTCRLKRFWDPLSTRLAKRFGPKHRLRGHSRAITTIGSRRKTVVETDAGAAVAVTVAPVHQLRPSGSPLATQRRAISVVEEQNGEDHDHADHASDGLLTNRERCFQRLRRGVPGPHLCGARCVAGRAFLHKYGPGTSRWRGFFRLRGR